MKLNILLFFFIIFGYGQVKLNKNLDLDILLVNNNINYVDLINGIDPIIILNNNSKNTYIVDPFGFINNNIIIDNEGNVIVPEKKTIEGYYKRFDEKQCLEDLIVLKPKESITLPLYIFVLQGSYDFKNNGKYYLLLNSYHSKSTILKYGCSEFIDKLMKRGYIVLEDSIDVQIPLVYKKLKN